LKDCGRKRDTAASGNTERLGRKTNRGMDLEQDNRGGGLEEPGKSMLSPEEERPREELATTGRGPFEEELRRTRLPARSVEEGM
jgi:hypothetical protein